jgi:hypothetical protein
MLVKLRNHGWVVRSGSAALLTSLILAVSSSAAWGWSSCTSDLRGTASLYGSPKSCSSIGLRGDTRVGSYFGHGASDVNLEGTVKTNEGVIEPGTGQELDIALTGPSNVVVDAVVIAGGFRHNIYRNSRFLPPTLGPDQHYIAPFDIFHKVPGINYWFACYHVDPASALPEAPQVLEVPLAGGAILAAWMFVHRRRRRAALAS